MYFFNESNLLKLLDAEDVSLEAILNEGDLLNECRLQNKKLMDYLLDDAVFNRLLDYCFDEPDEKISYELRFDLCNKACNVLTIDVEAINAKLFNTTNIYSRMDNFLVVDKTNPLMASFYTQIVQLFFYRHTQSFIEKSQSYLSRFCTKMDLSAFCDLMLKFISFSEFGSPNDELVEKWLIKNDIVSLLIENVKNCNSLDREELRSNSCIILCEIAQRDDNSSVFLERHVDELLELLPMSATILVSVLEVNRLDIASKVAQKFLRLREILEYSPTADEDTDEARLPQRFGIDRLNTLRVLNSCLRYSTNDVQVAFISCNIFDTLVNLMNVFVLNSFLHCEFVKLVNSLLSSESEDLFDYLLRKIFEFVEAMWHRNSKQVSNGIGRLPCMGQVLNVAELCYNKMHSMDGRMPDSDWSDFYESTIKDAVEANERTTNLLGSSSGDGGSFTMMEPFEHKNVMQKAFEEYQCQNFKSELFKFTEERIEHKLKRVDADIISGQMDKLTTRDLHTVDDDDEDGGGSELRHDIEAEFEAATFPSNHFPPKFFEDESVEWLKNKISASDSVTNEPNVEDIVQDFDPFGSADDPFQESSKGNDGTTASHSSTFSTASTVDNNIEFVADFSNI